MDISQLQHSDESCTECLSYLFERQTELWDHAKTYLLNCAPSRSSAAADEEDVFRVLGTVLHIFLSEAERA